MSPCSITGSRSPRDRRPRCSAIPRSSKHTLGRVTKRIWPVLEVLDIHTSYGNIRALKGISLRVERGEIVTLIGSNGAGKTTTLKTIIGTLKPERGEIQFDGRRIDRLSTDKVVRLGIAQSPEGRRIFARMSVLENLELGAFARADKHNVAGDMKRVLALFPRLN